MSTFKDNLERLWDKYAAVSVNEDTKYQRLAVSQTQSNFNCVHCLQQNLLLCKWFDFLLSSPFRKSDFTSNNFGSCPKTTPPHVLHKFSFLVERVITTSHTYTFPLFHAVLCIFSYLCPTFLPNVDPNIIKHIVNSVGRKTMKMCSFLFLIPQFR